MSRNAEQHLADVADILRRLEAGILSFKTKPESDRGGIMRSNAARDAHNSMVEMMHEMMLPLVRAALRRCATGSDE